MSASTGAIRLPDAPVLVAGFAGAAWLDTTGEVLLLTPQDAARRLARTRPILCHGPATARRLGIERFAAFDLLELFAVADDMDGLRKVPDNVPNPAMLREHLGRPLTRIPDPFGK